MQNIKFDTKKIERKIKKIAEEKSKELIIKTNIDGGNNMTLLNELQKEFLSIILSKEDNNYEYHGLLSEFPKYMNVGDLFKQLEYAGYCSTHDIYITGEWRCILTPQGINYFEKEEEYKNMKEKTNINIEQFINNGNNIFGNVFDSNFNIDNSCSNIEKMIDEKGGEDSEELKLVLSDIKEYLENINDSKYISTNKSLFEKIGNHIQKHQWFYQMVVNMLGMAVMNRMGGN